jgi:hypothetical protein
MTLMATHGGLRGRPGEGLTPEAIQRVVAGLVAFLERRRLPLSVAVARDSRPSGQAVAGHVVTSLTAAGAEVMDLGVAATPAAKLAARRRALGGAAIGLGERAADGEAYELAPLVGGDDHRHRRGTRPTSCSRPCPAFPIHDEREPSFHRAAQARPTPGGAA